jgi:hypothetical protein
VGCRDLFRRHRNVRDAHVGCIELSAVFDQGAVPVAFDIVENPRDGLNVAFSKIDISANDALHLFFGGGGRVAEDFHRFFPFCKAVLL